MHDIRVLDVVDTTDIAKGEPRASAVIRLGDTNYSSIRRADLGDMHDIFVDGVTCRAKCGVRISGPLSDTVIRDVTVPADARKYDITAPTQKVVTE